MDKDEAAKTLGFQPRRVGDAKSLGAVSDKCNSVMETDHGLGLDFPPIGREGTAVVQALWSLYCPRPNWQRGDGRDLLGEAAGLFGL